MFSELLATGLLVSAVGLQQPKKAIQTQNMFGGYCVRSYEDYGTMKTKLDEFVLNESYTFSYNYETSGYNLFGFFQSENKYQSTLTLNINYNGNYIDFEMYDIVADDYYMSSRMGLSGFDMSDMPADLQNLCLYFVEYTQMTTNDYKFLTTIFTKEGNEVVTRYTGWYTFNTSLVGTYIVMGNITANNTLYNDMEQYATQQQVFFSYVLNEETPYAEYLKQRTIYLQDVLLPSNVKSSMLASGQFAYIPDSNMSTFQDLFFSLADTPIYYLTTWFNFELLGFNVGVALISIMTLLVILFVVKKLV